jgi:hypothetical protein
LVFVSVIQGPQQVGLYREMKYGDAHLHLRVQCT